MYRPLYSARAALLLAGRLTVPASYWLGCVVWVPPVCRRAVRTGDGEMSAGWWTAEITDNIQGVQYTVYRVIYIVRAWNINIVTFDNG